jgi:dTDP-glucose 4,6-dehydratase
MDARLERSQKGSSRRLFQFVADRPGHGFRYAIDATKIQEELEWSASNSVEEAMGATVEWYLNHMDWVNAVRAGEYRKWI